MLVEDITLNSGTFYHGSYDKVGEWHQPSLDYPFFITQDYDYAKEYAMNPPASSMFAEYKKSKTESDNLFIYKVTLKNNLKIFDFRDKNDLKLIFPESMLDDYSPFNKRFKNPGTNGYDLYMICNALHFFKTECYLHNIGNSKAGWHKWNDYYYAKNWGLSEEAFREAASFFTSLDKNAKTFLSAIKNDKKFGENYDNRRTILEKLTEIGYSCFVTTEMTHKVKTQCAIGICDINILNKISINPC